MITICTLLLSACCVFTLIRIVLGPTITDRIIALDILFAIAIAFCLLNAIGTQRHLYLDIALGLALIGFVATISWAKFIEHLKR